MINTIELIDYTKWIGEYYDNPKLKEAAQRLRELDKPDCVWTATKVAELDCFKPACTNAVMYFDLEKKHFCPNCGGTVKEST